MSGPDSAGFGVENLADVVGCRIESPVGAKLFGEPSPGLARFGDENPGRAHLPAQAGDHEADASAAGYEYVVAGFDFSPVNGAQRASQRFG